VALFTGRKEILDKMHKYFMLDCDFQCVFVLHSLGGSGKSQLAFKFVQESTWYGSTIYEITTGDNLYFSFSASPTSSTLMQPMNKLFKLILRPSLQEILSNQQM
jgi:hypothetical protein